MKEKVTIIGAGLAGLIAANMLRHRSPFIIEKAPQLPHNHKALLRFRSPEVGIATGIPFTPVQVHKGIWTGTQVVNTCTIPLANNYSRNVTDGEISARSIWTVTGNVEQRWLAPEDFVERMAANVPIDFGRDYFEEPAKEGRAVISTAPMPILIDKLGTIAGAHPMCAYSPITAIVVPLSITSTVNQTVYNGSSDMSWYRATLQGRELIIETKITSVGFGGTFPMEKIEQIMKQCFGFACSFIQPRFNLQNFGKLLPTNNRERQGFIRWLTIQHGIYSLGRFATWRNILLDDVVKDVDTIERLIEGGDYAAALKA